MCFTTDALNDRNSSHTVRNNPGCVIGNSLTGPVKPVLHSPYNINSIDKRKALLAIKPFYYDKYLDHDFMEEFSQV